MIRRRILPILGLLVLLAGVTGGNALAQETQSAVYAPGSVTYNIYATDGFVTLADGTQIYDYGFIGGRADRPLQWLNEDNTLGSLGGAPAPAPSPGPMSDAEKLLQGNAQLPGPLIYAAVGDVVTINFKNLGVYNTGAPNDPHSIHLHGLDVNAANDGVPETSVGAVPANLCQPEDNPVNAPSGMNCSDAGMTPVHGAGNVIVYMFTPRRAATYMYHCHQEADIHVQMGMYGALVIYNPTDPAAATGPGSGKGGRLFGWSYDRDYVLLETEVDVRQHCSEQGTYANGLCPGIPTEPGQLDAWNPVDYKPQYWLLNGLSFPNTVHVSTDPAGINWDNWIQSHPGYDPLIVGRAGPRTNQRVLLRMINLGFETQPMHMHGYHAKVIGSDQRAWPWANSPGDTPFGQGLEKNTFTVGSGETYELLINMNDQAVRSTYPAGTQTRYYDGSVDCQAAIQAAGIKVPAINDPVANTITRCPVTRDYIGGPAVSGTALGPSTSQFFPFHNHDDYKATNNGTYPGGMFTMIIPVP
jgi:manganese oxidase